MRRTWTWPRSRLAVALVLCLVVAPLLATTAGAHKPHRWRYTMPPCNADQYTDASRGAAEIDTIVIHTAEGLNTQHTFDPVVNFLDCNEEKVSAHYVVGQRGEYAQVVHDEDVANHARYYNGRSIGIETDVHAAHDEWNSAMYHTLAHLGRYLADQYNVPLSHPTGKASGYLGTCGRYSSPFTGTGFVAHSQIDPNCRSDPGPYFDWTRFMSLVQRSDGGSKVGVAGPPTHYGGSLSYGATTVGNWREVERYWGLHDPGVGRAMDAITDVSRCGSSQTAVVGMHGSETVEVLMLLGGQYDTLGLNAVADVPGPVGIHVYVDGVFQETVLFDNNDNCYEYRAITLDPIAYGVHAVSLRFDEDVYLGTGADLDRNMYLDAVRVT